MADEADGPVLIAVAARLSGVPARTIRAWVKAGKLTAHSGGAGRVVKLADVRQLVATSRYPHRTVQDAPLAGEVLTLLTAVRDTDSRAALESFHERNQSSIRELLRNVSMQQSQLMQPILEQQARWMASVQPVLENMQPVLEQQAQWLASVQPILEQQARARASVIESFTAKAVADAMSGFLQGFRQWQEQNTKAVADALNGFLQGVQWQEQNDIADAFYEYGLISSPSMPSALVTEVVVSHSSGVPAEEVHDKVLSFFDEDGCIVLGDIVEGLIASGVFPGRDGVFRDTLTAHRMGLDCITTLALVPIIEAITTEAFTPWIGSKLKHNQIAPTLKDLVDDLPAGWVKAGGIAHITTTIKYMETFLYQPVYSDNPLRTNTDHPRRHALAHGWAKAGTRMNTIRCLLILDCLRIFLPILRQMYDPVEDKDGSSAADA